jgi:hypothetical protein
MSANDRTIASPHLQLNQHGPRTPADLPPRSFSESLVARRQNDHRFSSLGLSYSQTGKAKRGAQPPEKDLSRCARPGGTPRHSAAATAESTSLT